jgi:transcriptional regulator with XRE-family HTH domain
MKHVDDTAALGRRIKRLREERGLTQRQLMFDGCSYAYLSRVEQGHRQPSGQVLEELARRLGTTVRYLKTGEPDPVELGLKDAGFAIDDLTDDERGMLDLELEQQAFKTARGVAYAIKALRAEAARAVLNGNHHHEGETDDGIDS